MEKIVMKEYLQKLNEILETDGELETPVKNTLPPGIIGNMTPTGENKTEDDLIDDLMIILNYLHKQHEMEDGEREKAESAPNSDEIEAIKDDKPSATKVLIDILTIIGPKASALGINSPIKAQADRVLHRARMLRKMHTDLFDAEQEEDY
jgi:hypothetical protein